VTHPICHFEIPVDDLQRAKKFYQALDTEGNVFAIWEENPQAQ